MTVAPTSSAGECPILAEAVFSRTSMAILNEIRGYQLGRAVVLSGPGAPRVVSPTDPIDFMELLLYGYTYYHVVDTSAKRTQRKENRRVATNPQYTFDLIIDMSASIHDPVLFLRDFGSKASIFDAFYADLMQDISGDLADCHPEDMRQAQATIAAVCANITKTQPYHRGVRILQFNVRVEYGPELLKEIETFDRLAKDAKFGEEMWIMREHTDPANAASYAKLRTTLRDARKERFQTTQEQTRQSLSTLGEIAKVTGEEMFELVKQARLTEKVLPHVFEQPRQHEKVTEVQLSDLRARQRSIVSNPSGALPAKTDEPKS